MLLPPPAVPATGPVGAEDGGVPALLAPVVLPELCEPLWPVPVDPLGVTGGAPAV